MDGLTIDGGEWWFNVRPSNTEPLLRLNVEARDDAQMAELRDAVLSIMRSEA
jgi:phosphomannomutase